MTAILAWLFSPLGRWLAIGATTLVILTGSHLYVYEKGFSSGANRVQAKWDRAVQITIERGEKARAYAERDVERDPDGLRDDPLNRDKR